jgi:hypothetical protein
MWFSRKKRKDAGGERAGSGRPNTRLGGRPRLAAGTLRRFALLAALAAAGAAAGVFAVWKTGAVLFWENPRFTIRTLTIKIDGHSITEQHMRDYTGLAEGMNSFAINLGRLHDEVLRKAPNVRSMALARRLPDTIVIEVAERITLAKIGRWPGVLGVDRDGWLFTLRAGGREVPALSGLATALLRPGARIDASAFPALELIDACNRSRFAEQVKIASVDVSRKECLEVYLGEGERVRLSWEGMDTPTPTSRQNLDHKLAQLAQALRTSAERGRRLATIDLTFHDQYAPAQEF